MSRLVLVVIPVAVGVVVDLLTGYSTFPGYGATIGLAGCAAIILGSKWLGKRALQRPEDYYPQDVPADVQEDLHG